MEAIRVIVPAGGGVTPPCSHSSHDPGLDVPGAGRASETFPLHQCCICGHIYEAPHFTAMRHVDPQPLEPCPLSGSHTESATGDAPQMEGGRTLTRLRAPH